MVLSIIGLAGCASQVQTGSPPLSSAPQVRSPSTPQADLRSLYQRLGGLPAITAVVDDFLARVQTNPLVRARFEGINVPRLRSKLIEQVSETTGGPQKYTGIEMQALHRGMDVTEDEFAAVAGELTNSLTAFHVPEREQQELLGAVAALKPKIVAPPPQRDERLRALEILVRRIDARTDEISRRLEDSDRSRQGVVPKRPPVRSAAERVVPIASGKAVAAQAWTPGERDLAPKLVERYERSSPAPNANDRGDLVGGPLAHTRFLQDNGEVVDLNDLLGQPVVLVIMRGFGGAVCLHCSTQMLALATHRQEFERQRARVFVVYPGDAETIPVFIKSVRALDPRFRPPFPILLDVDLAAVRAFMIEGNLAKPTTMLIDAQGAVRWAYVGKQPADRPSVALILRQLARIDDPLQ
ncbi:MAG: redoxin domain-containing protein [Gammaproteobacteria bacterium]